MGFSLWRTFEAGLDGFDGPSRLLHGARQAGRVVVDHGGHVELQHLDVLVDDVRRRAGLLVALQLVVGLDDVGQLVRQVVLPTPSNYVGRWRIFEMEYNSNNEPDYEPIRT